MLRLFLVVFLIIQFGPIHAQQHSVGFGIHSGFTVPVSLDKGMDGDPRYNSRYTLKSAPIGFTLMKDYEGFGFLLSPGLITIGQNYDVVNTEGGHDGKREIDMRYFTVPFAFKLHLIDLDFFRVSALFSISGAYLYKVDDRIFHDNTKLKFPMETYPLLPEGYTVQYDGVLVPTIKNQSLSKIDNYNSFQVFGGVGLRSDWDVSNHWRVSIDFRMNYGLLESRNDDYLQKIEKYESLYDLPGSRKEMFAQMSFGISRFIDFDKNDKEREKKLKGSRRMYSPPKQTKARSKPKR